MRLDPPRRPPAIRSSDARRRLRGRRDARPGISRGTVYRTLDTLARLRLIVRVSHPGSAARYDGHTERHHHLVCEECGAIRDLEDAGLDALEIPRTRRDRVPGARLLRLLPRSLLPVRRALRLVQEIQAELTRNKKEIVMNTRFPMLAVALVITSAGLFASPQDPPPKGKTSYAPVDQTEPFECGPRAHEPGEGRHHEEAQGAARGALRPRRQAGRRASRCRAARPCRTACARSSPAGATWDALGAMTPERDPRARTSSRRASCRCRTRTTPRAGCSSRSSTSTRSRSRTARDLDALRPRLRPARPLPARVPAADLPDDAPRPRRRLAGQARHDRQLLRAVQRHPEPEAARGPAPARDAVPAAAVQPDRRPPHRAAEPRRDLLRLPRRTATRTAATHLVGDIRPQEFRHRIDTPSPARREHPAPLRLAARAEDASRTSPSSSSAPPTSTATR